VRNSFSFRSAALRTFDSGVYQDVSDSGKVGEVGSGIRLGGFKINDIFTNGVRDFVYRRAPLIAVDKGGISYLAVCGF
jgi:hypothetical protein